VPAVVFGGTSVEPFSSALNVVVAAWLGEPDANKTALAAPPTP
jgi:hypothetical protein